MDVAAAISMLLFDHEQVVVPGLGTFTTEFVEGGIHPVEHSFQPAYKKIRFQYNEQVADDGLLSGVIKEKGVKQSIPDFVNEVKNALKAGKKYPLKNIGHLYAHHTGEIVLEQDLGFNYVKKNFGLQGFIQKPVQKAAPQETIKASPAVEEEKSSYAWIFALAAILIVGAIVFWQWDNLSGLWKPGKTVVENTTSGKVESADVPDETPSSSVTAQPDSSMAEVPDTTTNFVEEKVTFDDGAVDEEDVQETAVAGEALPKEQNVQESAEAEPEAVSNTEPASLQLKGVVYYVIAGCFESKIKAEELAANLRAEGFENAQVHGTIGRLHRVCYTAFPTKREANLFQRELNKQGKTGVWIQRARW